MSAIERANLLLAQLADQRFFGTVAFQFKRGEIVLVRKEATLTPAELPNGRTDYDPRQSR